MHTYRIVHAPRAAHRLAQGLLLASGLACGQGLVPGNFEGDPLFQTEALVCGDSPIAQAAHPTVGVAWKDPHSSQLQLSDFQKLSSKEFPASFQFALFDAPTHLAPLLLEHPEGYLAANIGCPVLFDDLDQNGQHDPAEPFLAVAWNQLILRPRPEVSHTDLIHFDQTLRTPVDSSAAFIRTMGQCNADQMPEGLHVARPTQMLDLMLLLESGSIPSTPPESACVRFF